MRLRRLIVFIAIIQAILFLLAVTGAVAALWRLRERALGIETGLEYEDDGAPVVRTLGLTGH